MKDMTQRQREVLGFMRGFAEKHGAPPIRSGFIQMRGFWSLGISVSLLIGDKVAQKREPRHLGRHPEPCIPGARTP